MFAKVRREEQAQIERRQAGMQRKTIYREGTSPNSDEEGVATLFSAALTARIRLWLYLMQQQSWLHCAF